MKEEGAKGEGLLKALRRAYGDKPFTLYEARSLRGDSARYVRKVFEKWMEVGILKEDKKCTCRPAYRIDPDESGRLLCPIDNEPYEQSACPTVERLIECSVIYPDSECNQLLDEFIKLRRSLLGTGAHNHNFIVERVQQ
jgi:hypothetical protein